MQRDRRQPGRGARALQGLPAADQAAGRVLSARGRRSARSTARSRRIASRRIWPRRSRRPATAVTARWRQRGDRLPIGRRARTDARGRTAGRRSADRVDGEGRAGREHGGSRRAGGEADQAGGATPAFKGYHGYPATICASINDEVIHGIPSGRRVLAEGDIISIDVGASLEGYFGDSAVTLPVGQVSEQAATLLRVTEESLYKAIERGAAGRAGVGYRPRRAEARRGVRVFGRARVRRPRHRRSGCTRSRRCRTTASPGAGRGWPRAWCSRSSRW